jgi:4'-phosphopantetheinyl transferase
LIPVQREFARIAPGAGWPRALAGSLPGRSVDVWGFALDADAGDVERWQSTLPDDERARASRFVRVADRSAFIVSHGVMRALLAGYCGVAAEALTFVQPHGGKPSIAHPQAAGIRFSLAHSGRGAMLAVCKEREVGVDLEALRDTVDVAALSRQFFGATEHAAIVAQPASRQIEAFVRYWVAKEAVVKAAGTGMATALSSFAIVFADDGESARVEWDDSAAKRVDGLVRMLDVPPGYLAALHAPHGFEVRRRAPPSR